MATAFDVAKYILEKNGEMTAMKLQKLVYYSQAWSLVWDEEPLFEDTIEAWAAGPVIRELYNVHRGKFKVRSDIFTVGNSDNLSKEQMETIDAVLDFYGDKTAQWLSDLAHMESPWAEARKSEGVQDGERSTAEITLATMHEYYSGLQDEQKTHS